MIDLDEAWALALAEAEKRAKAAGRGDVAEYLALRASNDLLRQTGVEWLLTTVTRLAGEANRLGSSIQISKQDPYRFRVGSSTMVGTLLTLRFGVRSLAIEAGWPRTPRDGVVRGGGLASGQIKHFGRRSADEEILLVRAENDSPRWLVLERNGGRTDLLEREIRNHLDRFTGELD